MKRFKDLPDRFLRSSRAILLFLGFVMVLRGTFYMQTEISGDMSIPALERYVPLWAWAAVWMVSGLAVVACAILGRIPSGAAIASALAALWAALLTVGWLAGQTITGYSSALQYALISVLIASVFARSQQPVTREEDGD